MAAVWPVMLRPIAELFRGRAVRSKAPWRRGALTTRELTVHENLDATATRCRALLSNLGSEQSGEEPITGMRLQVVTPKSNKSSGSVLRIDLNDVAGNTKVTISGWPGAQLFDFGESKRLVEKVASGLVEKSPSKRPSS